MSNLKKYCADRVDKETTVPSKNYIQARLQVGAVNDPLEHEADAVADQVMRMPANGLIQRKCTDCEEEDKLQRKPLASFIQKKGEQVGIQASESVSNRINFSRGKGSSLPNSTKNFMESRFGTEFSNVNIHTGREAAHLSRELGAKAFTVENDIYFNQGQYNPGSNEGKRLLAHELTHVVQQLKGSPGLIQRQPVPSPVYEDLEKLVSAGKWCRDSKKSGELHPGLQCFREIPPSKGHPPGEQYCFDINSPNEFKETSPDDVSAVSGQLPDGTCDIAMKLTDPPNPFTQRGRRSLGHLIADIATEDADMIGTVFGAAAGVSMGMGLPKDDIGLGSIIYPSILGALGALLGRKGLPKLNSFAKRHGFVPTISLGVSSAPDLGLGIGLEQRRSPLPLIPINSYLTFDIDSTLSLDDSSITANVGIRVDRAEQGGLFAFGTLGGGFRVGGTDANLVGTSEAGIGYRFTDFMDVRVARESIYEDGEKNATYWVTLKLVAPQSALK